MQYEDWLSNQLPRTDKFIKFLQECMREVNSFERQGKPILVHDKYVVTTCTCIYHYMCMYIHVYIPLHVTIQCTCVMYTPLHDGHYTYNS